MTALNQSWQYGLRVGRELLGPTPLTVQPRGPDPISSAKVAGSLAFQGGVTGDEGAAILLEQEEICTGRGEPVSPGSADGNEIPYKNAPRAIALYS